MRRLGFALLAMAGCKAPDVAPVEPAVVAEDPKPSVTSSPLPAFIVIRRETTDIIAVDGRQTTSRHGLWTMLSGASGTQIGGLFTSELSTDLESRAKVDAVVPVCSDANVVGGCPMGESYDLFGQATVDPRGTLRWGVSPVDYGRCDCLIIEYLSTDPMLDEDETEAVDLEEVELSPYSVEEYADVCSDLDVVPEPLAIVGPMLYRAAVWDNLTCSGVHLMDLEGDSVPLIPGADPLTPFESAEGRFCEMYGEPNVAWLADYDSECQFGSEGCEDCYTYDELDAYAIRRGNLFNVTGSASAGGGVCTCASPRPLSSDRCPSPLDPCGDPTGFEGVAKAPYFWVETQSRWALVGDAKRLEVRSPTEVLNQTARADDVLGVHFVEDARPLADLQWQAPEVIGLQVPPLAAEDAGFYGDAGEWGNRCFAHFKEGRLDAAEAACMRGLLDEGGTATTRGAITYSLGRIAEARGEAGRAKAYYERSLVLRPGNAAVEERLAGL